MHVEYLERRAGKLRRAAARLGELRSDHRSQASLDALAAVTSELPGDALCLSVGGGPGRAHGCLVNLNVDRFPNVDVVADAYRLPYADAAVDSVHCEAVLEHLETPEAALAEVHRVLRPGGLAYFATPFLQAYHAYPGHYQNFTLEGHNAIIRRSGLRVLAAGTCVGPTFAAIDLASTYLRLFLPGAGRLAWLLLRLVGKAIIPLDRRLNRAPLASHLASSVFALAVR